MQAKNPKFFQLAVVTPDLRDSNLRMSRLGKVMRDFRKKHKVTQAAMARRLNMSDQTISNIETGKNLPAPQTYNLLAPILGRTVEELVKLSDEPGRDANDDNTVIGESKFYEIPEYEMLTGATHWVPLEGEDEWAEHGKHPIIEQGLFRIRIRGDCMETRWHSGDLIEFRIWRQGGDEPMPVGKDVVVTRSDRTSTFKRLVKADEEKITLAARNKAYAKKIEVPMQEVVRIAVALHAIDVRPE